MKAAQKGRGGKQDHEVSSVILQFRRPARKFSECSACGGVFQPLQSWHALCPQCYRGAQLYRAITRYLAVLR